MSSGLIVGWQSYGQQVFALDRGAFPTEYITLTDGWYPDPAAVAAEILVQTALTTNFTDVFLGANNWDDPFVWVIDPPAGVATVTCLSVDLADWLGMDFMTGLVVPVVPGTVDCPHSPGGQVAFVSANAAPTHRRVYHRSGSIDHRGIAGRPAIGKHDEIDLSFWLFERERQQALRVFRRLTEGAHARWYQDWTLAGPFAWGAASIEGYYDVAWIGSSLDLGNLVGDELATAKELRLTLARW